jgi:hypothetical protein
MMSEQRAFEVESAAKEYGSDEKRPADVYSEEDEVEDDVYAPLLLRVCDIPEPDPLTSTRPFPIDPGLPDEPNQLTVRAIVVGCALGAVGESLLPEPIGVQSLSLSQLVLRISISALRPGLHSALSCLV